MSHHVLHLLYPRPAECCIGSTEDLKLRLIKHSEGDVPHTSEFTPWKVEVYLAFETREKAAAFEDDLKSGSGHAFVKRHFSFEPLIDSLQNSNRLSESSRFLV